MEEQESLAERFESERSRLRAVAYRMLGSRSEAEDAVQEVWLRLSRAGTEGVENMGGWLTTVVARVCLDMLRSRKSHREEPLDLQSPLSQDAGTDPEYEALLADSVGLAMLVVLETLAPAERIAFVLHDIFDVPFDEIAPIVGRSSTAARQLASRARRRVQGGQAAVEADRTRQREVIDAFLAASRGGDFEALLAVLDPEVVFHSDSAAVQAGGPQEVRGASGVARLFVGRAQAAKPALIDGAMGVMVAPNGRLFLVLLPTLVNGRIAKIEAVADAERLQRLDIRLLDVPKERRSVNSACAASDVLSAQAELP